jgi:hypothetical protein
MVRIVSRDASKIRAIRIITGIEKISARISGAMKIHSLPE